MTDISKKKIVILLYLIVFAILLISYIGTLLFADEEDPDAIFGDLKSGLIWDEDGELRYYDKGEMIHAGLIQDEEGNYYYINSTLKAVRNVTYYVTITNDLLPAAKYYFDAEGKLVFDNEKHGIYADGSDRICYIKGVIQEGVFEYEGGIYYASSGSGILKSGVYFLFAKDTNGLIAVDGCYNFASDGRLVNPPTDADITKTGLYFDFDGEIRYYKNGFAQHAGLVQDESGNYYYINSSRKAVRSQSYTVSITNGLLPAAEYTFGDDGKMIKPPS